MGGSAEFRARRKISMTSVNGMKPVESETFAYKNKNTELKYTYDFDEGRSDSWDEPGYGSSINVSTQNRGDVYKEVNIDYYVVNGDYYGKFDLNGQTYVVKDEKIDDFIKRKLGKDFDSIESVSDDIISTIQHENQTDWVPMTGWSGAESRSIDADNWFID